LSPATPTMTSGQREAGFTFVAEREAGFTLGEEI
jgi:hypothetical protein